MKKTERTSKSISKRAATSGRVKAQKKDLRNMTMALKDEADNQKKLYHPELVE